MITTKNLGICMDYFSARLMTFTSTHIQTTIIDSKLNQCEQAENLFYYSYKELQYHYYNQVRVAITNYEDVILFGPTDAKVEFLRLLIENKCLPSIKIRIKYTETMTDCQQQIFVKNYFRVFP